MSVAGFCVAVLSCVGCGPVMGTLANVTAMVCRLAGRKVDSWMDGWLGGWVDEWLHGPIDN